MEVLDPVVVAGNQNLGQAVPPAIPPSVHKILQSVQAPFNYCAAQTCQQLNKIPGWQLIKPIATTTLSAALTIAKPIYNRTLKKHVDSALPYLVVAGGLAATCTAYRIFSPFLNLTYLLGSWTVGPVVSSTSQFIFSSVLAQITVISNSLGKQVGEFLGGLTTASVSAFLSTSISVGYTIIKEVTWNMSWQQRLFMCTYFGGAFAFTFTSKVILDVVDYYSISAKKAIGAPLLAVESYKAKRLSFIARYADNYFSEFFNRFKPKAFFNKDLQDDINRIIWISKNSKETGKYLPNVLLYGPPGTGKTMVAKKIAQESGCNYVAMAGPQLAACIANGTHISEFNKLLKHAKKSGEPTILFIDEVETFAGDRDQLDQARQELLNVFLNETGNGCSNLMVIAATNKREKLDPAFRSRMTYEREVGLPDSESRFHILKDNIEHRFRNSEELKTVFTDSYLRKIASETYGMTGRDLTMLVYQIRAKKWGFRNNESLTEAIVDKTIYEFVKQKRGPNIFKRTWKDLTEKVERAVNVGRDVWYFEIIHTFRACIRGAVALKEQLYIPIRKPRSIKT